MGTGSYWLEMVLFIGFYVNYAENRYPIVQSKCQNREVAIQRHFYVEEHELPIKIEVSNRITHQLVSNIFKILLTEVIGYPKVVLIESGIERGIAGDSATRTLQKISNCIDPRTCHPIAVSTGPEVMINLEVWLVPGFSTEGWTSTGEVDDCGPLGPVGRSGWLVADDAVQELWRSNRTILNHWRAFTDPDVVALFDLSEDIMIRSSTFNPNTNTTYCNFEECGNEGIYRPKQCRGIQCATLLADYAESSFFSLKHQIDKLKLLVNVAWVGGKLVNIVHKRTGLRKYTVFFHTKPSFLTSLSNFSLVSFPPCEEDSSLLCNYDVYQLEKIAWSKIRTNAPLIFHLIRTMSFSQQAYYELLERYNIGKTRGYNIEEIACSWVKDNAYFWDRWIPDAFKEKTILYIGGIFPFTGVYWKQKGVVPAARMAVEAVNRNNSLLTDYQLSLLEQDGQCMADEVMKSFINYVTNSTYKTMVGILGPACSDTVEPIAGVAKHFNIIIISYSAEGSLFNDREKYPYFFRTIPENNQFRYVYLKLFQKLNWHRVAALTEDGQKYPEYISHLQDLLQSNGMDFIANRKFPRERTSLDMKLYLSYLKEKNARIIIGDFYDYAARAVMCAAYQMGMTAANGYQWFLPLWFTSDWFDTDLHNSMAKQHYEHVPCTTEQMIDAINGHMSLAYKFYADDDVVMQEGQTVSNWRKSYKAHALKQNMEESRYGGYAYDAIWVYALALDALFKENNSYAATLHNVKTSRRLVELLNETNFTGVSGPLQFVGSSRLSEVVIWQWLKNTTRKIGVYRPYSKTEGDLELNESCIVWLTADGMKPQDGRTSGSTCTLEAFRRRLNVSCETAVVIVNVIAVVLLIVVMLFCVVFFKRKYETEAKKTEARMRELGLIATSNIVALDEWEMPRDHIVINRKLGEGAFGTVYGGEAFIQSKGWIAVAVKTLKLGAKPEEKLDFLSEAEVMKKFNHMNIVQLVGVCTMGEPVYTVMEFMLYALNCKERTVYSEMHKAFPTLELMPVVMILGSAGDLKTYLLARRNLVNETDRSKNDEVSDRRLTNMALDVARGLSYLADLNYVHRDLACRNCLVNASRSVKIADFGMCRPMYDSDYYRFNKRGMLPVRWMAPESLTDGLFTPKSDVWSYGVLLYEIVTFGSFPYQGLSNNQVLEYVKNHNTLLVPKGCKPALGDLLKRCWARIPQDRPQAVEIVELLAGEPELISPCLDMPIASVEAEDTESLEITIHDRSRVHSVSSIWHSRRRLNAAERVANGHVDSYMTGTKEAGCATQIELKPSYSNSSKDCNNYVTVAQKPDQKPGNIRFSSQITRL